VAGTAAAHASEPGVFVPGFGAPRALYAACVPAGFEVLEPPSFRATRGDLAAYRRWLAGELARRDAPVVLAGHSMGAALAVLAACDHPGRVRRLVLVSPAGLPLSRPLWKSALTLLRQVADGLYPGPELRLATGRVLAAPLAALRLARTLRDLDLTPELERLAAAGVPCAVVACTTDRLTTPELGRRLARLAGATYEEVDAPGGHVWMLYRPELLRAALSGGRRRT
jgi:pimeloyl-ACP methyl ester carboxylesterase